VTIVVPPRIVFRVLGLRTPITTPLLSLIGQGTSERMKFADNLQASSSPSLTDDELKVGKQWVVDAWPCSRFGRGRQVVQHKQQESTAETKNSGVYYLDLYAVVSMICYVWEWCWSYSRMVWTRASGLGFGDTTWSGRFRSSRRKEDVTGPMAAIRAD